MRPEIHRVLPIDVLGRIDRQGGRFGAHAWRKWRQQQDAVDARVSVEAVKMLQKFRRFHRCSGHGQPAPEKLAFDLTAVRRRGFVSAADQCKRRRPPASLLKPCGAR